MNLVAVVLPAGGPHVLRYSKHYRTDSGAWTAQPYQCWRPNAIQQMSLPPSSWSLAANVHEPRLDSCFVACLMLMGHAATFQTC